MNIYIKVFYISTFFMCLCSHKGLSQRFLTNPSFEGAPADATMPSGWFAASESTTPDILPGYWGVYDEAEDGETYVGLITREDGSSESIYQRMETVMKAKTCYDFGLYLSHSHNYSGYNNPLHLRVYLSDKKNKRQQLIFESPLLDETSWEFHHIRAIPNKNMKYLILEAHNGNPDNKVKGNLLLDGILNPKLCDRV